MVNFRKPGHIWFLRNVNVMNSCFTSIIFIFTDAYKLSVYHVTGFFKGEKFPEFHKSISICENFILKMLLKTLYHNVLLTICEKFSY